MVDDLSGKVAFVTGGSSGIGKATVLAFVARGARVVIASRGEAAGQATVAEVEAAGGEALWVPTDVTQGPQVAAAVRAAVDTFGGLDYAFNNGGSGGRGGWLAEIAEEDWHQTIDGYLKSVWLCMKYEILAMLDQGHGAIVNNASVDGQRAFPMDPVYSAAKHGVLGLTKSAALQYAERGLRINAVCPGWIRTPPIQEMIDEHPEAEERMVLHQPIRRLGRPEEVAEAVVWLCSDRASLVLGTALAVDGGYLAV